MIRKLSALFAGALLGALAFGQSVPNGAITQGQIWTTAQWNAAFQAKVDVTSGTLNAPTINGPVIANPTITSGTQSSPAITTPTISNPTVTGGMSVTGTSALQGLTATSGAFSGAITQSGIAIPTYRRTAAEIAAGVTPANFTFPSGNALRYGVVCDGATDDFAAFTRAIASVPAGGSLFIPPSATMCELSADLVINKSMAVIASPGTVFLQAKTGNTSTPVLMSVTASNVTISGLGFDGGGTAFANTNVVVEDQGSANDTLFTNVTVQNTRGIGIAILAATNSGVTYSNFTNIGMLWQTSLLASDRHQAIVFTNTTGVKNYAIGNYFNGIGLDSISGTQQTGWIVAQNRCDLSTSQIAQAFGTWPACIFAQNDTGINIDSNISDSAPGNGIDIASGTTGVNITGNYVTGSGGAGISIAGVTDFSITGNTAVGNGLNTTSCERDGIDFLDAVTTGTVSTNVLTGNAEFGVFAFTACSHPATLSNVSVDANNAVTGNAAGAYGGAINGPVGYGTAIGQVPAFINFSGSGRPGLGLQNGTLGGLALGRSSAASSDGNDLIVSRTANYSGGTFGHTNSAIEAVDTVSAGTTAFEWTALFQLLNSGTSADASQDVALYARSQKLATGATWAATFELDDSSVSPVASSVSAEYDLRANGADAGGNRVVIDLVGDMLPGGSGVAPTITYGWRIGTGNATTTDATFGFGGFFNTATYGTLIGSSSTIVATNGIDLSASTFSGSPYKSSGFSVDHSGNTAAKSMTLTAVTIASLPTCGGGIAGQYMTVSNGVASPTYMGTVSATGSTTDPVFCNGTNWVYH